MREIQRKVAKATGEQRRLLWKMHGSASVRGFACLPPIWAPQASGRALGDMHATPPRSRAFLGRPPGFGHHPPSASPSQVARDRRWHCFGFHPLSSLENGNVTSQSPKESEIFLAQYSALTRTETEAQKDSDLQKNTL